MQLQVDRNDDGVAYTCKVVHEALQSVSQQTTEVLEVHCKSCLCLNLQLVFCFYFCISFHYFISLLSNFYYLGDFQMFKMIGFIVVGIILMT